MGSIVMGGGCLAKFRLVSMVICGRKKIYDDFCDMIGNEATASLVFHMLCPCQNVVSSLFLNLVF